MKKTELTLKQEKFCYYYIDTDGNASEAYRMSYNALNMKPETIWSNASRLLKDSKVIARIEEIRESRRKESEVKRETVEKVLMDIITADPKDMYIEDTETGRIRLKNPSQMPKKLRNSLKKIQNKKGEVTYEFTGKTEAARLLGSWNGWDAPKQVDITSNDRTIGELRIGFGEDSHE